MWLLSMYRLLRMDVQSREFIQIYDASRIGRGDTVNKFFCRSYRQGALDLKFSQQKSTQNIGIEQI